MSVGQERLSQQITEQLKVLQASYKIHSSGENLPTLSKPWQALSLGGDFYKLLAVNPELEIVAKRYARPEYAALENRGYQLIKPIVQKASFPLLLPLCLYEDIFAFPLVNNNIENVHDYDAMAELKKLIKEISLPLDLAGFLDRIKTKDNKTVYNDPFADSLIDFYCKTGILPD
ncbi:MAG: hypothetical protein US40_C0006G0001 [Candidatus Roizmanbacteria bacterium GW2011_GWC2_37_13]|uniref:Uncharacterized protein n=1 Tax=Candidatus Roizmanbacteria bacterium GW2011_GWC2_37_13 TaxID=1618486 RepID=A0A0G0IND4_9BACT|nr:MAG: hypothetical protein US38_C0010G0004 [Candidatus Roizmanbacteria bacterium GW2011_GWC1_37_12]KKQ25684.1 MAG: hypothetical protein US40_C0006G0001 [Candidatus Roizmanbacteria bacterium GW2011_GWC2_37_13]